MSKFEYNGIAVTCAATLLENGSFSGAAFVYLKGPDASAHYIADAARDARTAAEAHAAAFETAKKYIDAHRPRRKPLPPR